MEIRAKKRLSATVALVLLSPALPALLSGCANRDCDDNGSTLRTDDDCGRGARSGGAYRSSGGIISGRGGIGSAQTRARSGGFGGFGRSLGGSSS